MTNNAVILTIVFIVLALAGLYAYGTVTEEQPGNVQAAVVATKSDSQQIFANELAFGAGIDALDNVNKTRWTPEYVSVSAGRWMQTDRYGWQTFNGWLDKAAEADATPVVLWYYWGNDTTPTAITRGKNGKTVNEWYNMTERMGQSIDMIMGSKGAIVVLEPEFNKNGVENWTEFNDYLVNAAQILRRESPESKIVIGFGNWQNENWKNFDTAVNAADMVGYQGTVRAPERKRADYEDLVENSLSASQYLQRSFPNKPIIWYDLGVSTYSPGKGNATTYTQLQKTVLEDLFQNADELTRAGTRIVILKNLRDATQYVPESDRHWGVLDGKGNEKPAYTTWINGVRNVTSA